MQTPEWKWVKDLLLEVGDDAGRTLAETPPEKVSEMAFAQGVMSVVSMLTDDGFKRTLYDEVGDAEKWRAEQEKTNG